MAKICYGEFDWPNHRAKQTYLRERYLAAIAQHANEVWRDLCELLPLYDHLKEAQGARRFHSPKDFSADDLLTESLTSKPFLIKSKNTADLTCHGTRSVLFTDTSVPALQYHWSVWRPDMNLRRKSLRS